MLISLNEIKKYVKIPATITTEQLLELIGSRLVEIEEVTDLAPKYRQIYIVKVVSAEPIPGTHLTLCQIDVGEHTAEFPLVSATPDGTSSVTASKGSLSVPAVQVVCGAPNVHAGMLAVWLAPGAIVPCTYGNENFKLSTRKLQGYESNGMLAALDELDLGTDHEGIVEIDPATARPGDLFADVFELNDLIIDVENKSLTHRPDCFGLIGFAREVSGILGLPFAEPEWLSAAEPEWLGGATSLKPAAAARVGGTNNQAGAGLDATPAGGASRERHRAADQAAAAGGDTAAVQLQVEITDPDLCPRYSCAVFDLPSNTPSKYLTPAAVFLAKSGMRAIDPMVDLTNIMMLHTGQPLHAFDYDKLVAVSASSASSISAKPAPSASSASAKSSAAGAAKTASSAPVIIVRAAQPDEPIQLLDGKTITCTPSDILITANNTPVALAGAMGGKNTEIDTSTRRVILESATFSLYNLRKTQMAHGIFSEAITRFTKGQPAALTLPVLSETVHRLGVTPLAVVDSYPHPQPKNVVKITTSDINQLLGTDYSTELITDTLTNVGFSVSAAAALTITAPVWRTDIHIKEDIIEEVGRLLGFDNIPLSLPTKPFSGTETAPLWSLAHELRGILSGDLAMNELLTYSFISRSLLEKVGQDPQDSYAITNSISPELECFRQHITPSLLDKIRENQRSDHQDFTLYEINQVSTHSAGLTSEGTPQMQTHLGITTLGDFYRIKAIFLALLRHGLKIELEYSAFTPNSDTAKTYPYLEPLHSAAIILQGQTIGAMGEVKPAVLRRFKIDGPVAACELALNPLTALPRNLDVVKKISRFPFVERDLTLKVAADAAFGRFYALLAQLLEAQQLVYSVTPSSIYQTTPDASTKNISFHLKFSSPEKTLDQSEISAIMDSINVEVTQLGAEVV